jgi:hypothetical protein
LPTRSADAKILAALLAEQAAGLHDKNSNAEKKRRGKQKEKKP